MTQVALQTHKKDMMREIPSFAKQKFLYRLSRSDYEKEWGKDYRKPGVWLADPGGAHALHAEKGPLQGDGVQEPDSATEELYFKSINATVDQYRAFLEEVRTDSLVLPNCDLDDGKGTKAAEYSLTDDGLCKVAGQAVRAEVRSDHSRNCATNILNFYSNLSAPIETKKDSVRWQSVLTALDQLKLVSPVPALANSPKK